ECSDARQRNRRNVVPRGHDIGLHCVSGRFGRMARRHYSFVKSSGGAVAVIAASAQQDAALLVHRVVTSTGRRARPLSAVKGCEGALLCVAAAKVPAVAAPSAGNGSYETPRVDGGIGHVLLRIVPGEETGLHVRHDPRAGAAAAPPHGGGAEVYGLH